MSEETKNTAQEEETTDTPVTEETVENEPEVVENGEAETEEIPVEDGDEEASKLMQINIPTFPGKYYLCLKK